jgi:hypothetical protein
MMTRPFAPPDDPFERLKNRILFLMKESQIDEQVLDLVKNGFAEALRAENIVLTRAEHDRLFRAVLRDMLDDLLNDLPQS